MSKMQEPLVEIIHFKETDVIVASGYEKNAFLSGWGDNTSNNAKLIFKDNDKEVNYSWLVLHNEALEGMLSNLIFHRNDDVTLNDLAMNEDLSEEWNGRYKKGADGKWYWQGRQ